MNAPSPALFRARASITRSLGPSLGLLLNLPLGPSLAAGLALLALALGPLAGAQTAPGADGAAWDFLLQRGTLQGFPDGDLRPEEPVTRAQLAAALQRELALPAATVDCFPDVPEGAWFAPAVCALAAAELASGYPDGRFHPQRVVTVAEALKLLLSALDPPPAEAAGPASASAGAAPPASWGLPYWRWAELRGYLPPSGVVAEAPLNRGELAALLHRLLAPPDRSGSPALAAPADPLLSSAPPLPEAGGVRPSAGCRDPEWGPPLERVQVDGLTRAVLTHLPTGDPQRPRPLLFGFHGRTNSNAQFRRYSGLERAFPDAVILFPAGLPNSGGFSWTDPGDPPSAPRDAALFDRLLAEAASRYCLDLARVVLVGHSLGASFANQLACARGAEVRAVATVAGGVAPAPCSGRVAALLLHNPEDRLVPVAEGERTRELFRGLNAADGPAAPLDGALAASPLADLDCVGYGSGPAAATPPPVLWCPHDVDTGYDGRYYPHTWPRQTAAAIAAFVDALP